MTTEERLEALDKRLKAVESLVYDAISKMLESGDRREALLKDIQLKAEKLMKQETKKSRSKKDRR
ncbi:MAG: hypothetical protein KGL39_18135 [Patescibacteria group bacterium]|nr:hypothetical protein [Patescibacteria group bacterium]